MSYGLAGVDVAYGRVAALSRFDLDLASGSVHALIGPDGAGKTTVCKVLVGIRSPERGEVRRPPAHLVGYQPESAGSWPDLTVAENLDFVSRSFGNRGDGRIDELLELTRLGTARDRLAGDLSGGMRQKLAVAMAMLARPALLVLDEPTTGLDPVSRSELWRLVLRAAAEGAAVLVTTSYIYEAERADTVTFLDEGHAIATGTAASIRAGFQGVMSVTGERPEAGTFWRRGRNWRVWTLAGNTPANGTTVAPDLEDVVTAASMESVR